MWVWVLKQLLTTYRHKTIELWTLHVGQGSMHPMFLRSGRKPQMGKRIDTVGLWKTSPEQGKYMTAMYRITSTNSPGIYFLKSKKTKNFSLTE